MKKNVKIIILGIIIISLFAIIAKPFYWTHDSLYIKLIEYNEHTITVENVFNKEVSEIPRLFWLDKGLKKLQEYPTYCMVSYTKFFGIPLDVKVTKDWM
jgi:hypothetical protein